MKSMITKLCRDVLCFTQNYCFDIIILILTTTLLQISLDYILLPKKEALMFIHNFHGMRLQDIIKKLSLDQQYILLQLSAANSISKLISNTFLFGSILNMLHLLSVSTNRHYQHSNIKNIMQATILIFPKLLLLIFYITLFMQLGLMIAIIPGILLAIIISLAPITMITDNLSIKKSIYVSIKASYHNIYLVIPPILLWFLIKIILILISNQYYYSWTFITKIFINIFNNMLSTIILIYLYRLYMIIKIK